MGARTGAPVLVVGGGIGGMAAALALSQSGFAVELFEQSAEIGEIGAKGVLRLVRYSFFAGRT